MSLLTVTCEESFSFKFAVLSLIFSKLVFTAREEQSFCSNLRVIPSVNRAKCYIDVTLIAAQTHEMRILLRGNSKIASLDDD